MDQHKARELLKEMIHEALIKTPKLKEFKVKVGAVQHSGFGKPELTDTGYQFKGHDAFIEFITPLGAYGYTITSDTSIVILF